VGLRDAQLDAGATLASGDADRGLPLHFGSPRDEYAAATASAALFDLSDRSLIEMSGADRVRFLHSFCTNDIKRLSAGHGGEAFITSVKGKVLGHVWIDATENALWLDADPGSAERLVPHLERYVINEDVQIADRTADFGELRVVGPEAASRLGRLGIDVAALKNLDHTAGALAGILARVRRADVGPHPGFAVVVPHQRLADCWERLRDAGFRPAGSEVWTALRIEAGLPVFGVDISDDNLAQEVGRTKTAISFTKGCYLGQEPIARLDAMGHVNRELRSLWLAEGPVPQPGARLFSDEAATTGVGTITSSALSFGSNTPVAMALLRSNVSAIGAKVFVETSGTPIAATVFWQPAI
jgi:tRNA-modifying protein YgfZ